RRERIGMREELSEQPLAVRANLGGRRVGAQTIDEGKVREVLQIPAQPAIERVLLARVDDRLMAARVVDRQRRQKRACMMRDFFDTYDHDVLARSPAYPSRVTRRAPLLIS